MGFNSGFKGLTLATAVGGKCEGRIKNMKLYHCVTFQLVAICLVFRFKSNVYTVLTIPSSTESKCILSHAENTTARQSHVVLTGIYSLLVAKKGRRLYRAQKTSQSRVSAVVSKYHACTEINRQTYISCLDRDCTFDLRTL